MGAHNCSVHHIAFPYYYGAGGKCPVEGCNVKTLFIPNIEPDDDWREKAAAFNDAPYEEPALEIPDVDADVITLDGRQWVPHEVLIAAGYRNLEDFSIVKVRGVFYELQAHVGRCLTHGIRGGAWWVEEIEETAEALTPALFA